MLGVLSRDFVAVDLDRGRARQGPAPGFRHRGFDDAVVGARRARLTGDEHDNRLLSNGCDVLVEGAGGDDVLRPALKPYGAYGVDCPGDRTNTLLGGPGDDVMVGRRGPDVLDGGTGDDLADGGKGSDTCRAERKLQCER